MLSLAMLLTLLTVTPEVSDLVELPAVLGKMPHLRPPPVGLSEAVQQGEGVYLPYDLAIFMAKVLIVYPQLEEIGQAAIDAKTLADKRDCDLRVQNTPECQKCFWIATKWGMITGLTGIIAGGVLAAWTLGD